MIGVKSQMMSSWELEAIDPSLHRALIANQRRQQTTVNLIASENIPVSLVRDVLASPLGNKVIEGYPGARYHGGCKYADRIENIAIERARQLFGAEYANVQPHSGVSANLAVFSAAMPPGGSMLSMATRSGGHVSHGAPGSLAAKIYKIGFYDVDRDTELIDYHNVAETARQLRPQLIVAGSSSYPRLIDFQRFREIANEVGSSLHVDMAHIAGLVAAGVHPSPVPHADFVTGTTYKTLRGAKGAFILCRAEHANAMENAIFPGTQGSANASAIGAKALTFHLAGREEFRTYSRKVVATARALAAELGVRGLRPVAGGTDTHIVLIDVRSRGITGAEAQRRLERVGIIANRNQIPNDPLDHRSTSGLRLGTAATTSLGYGEEEMRELADVIDQTLSGRLGGASSVSALCRRVRDLCSAFPLSSAPSSAMEQRLPNALAIEEYGLGVSP